MRKAGQHIGTYTLDKRIGRGGMGEVWKAKDAKGNVVALKILLAGDEASSEEANRFKREADILSRLQHRGICRVLDIDEHEGQTFFVMEHIEGKTLSQILRSNQKLPTNFTEWSELTDQNDLDNENDELTSLSLTSDQTVFMKIPHDHAADLMIEICDAVLFAHNHGILHRDLKPSNIIITSEGSPIVLDFGIAKIDQGHHDINMTLTHTAQVLGTMGYMAPEQAVNNFMTDKASDVYALGAILYLMITGKRQFDPSEHFGQDIQRMQFHEPLAPRKHDPSLPISLDRIIAKSLRNDMLERYPNVEEFRDDLMRFRKGLPVLARKLQLGHEVKKWVSKNPTLCVFIFVIAVLLVSFGSYYINQEMKRYATWGRGEDITPKSQEELESKWHSSNIKRWKVSDEKLTSYKHNSLWLFYNEEIRGDVAFEFNAIIKDQENLSVGGDLSICLAFTNTNSKKRKGYILQVGGMYNKYTTINKFPFSLQQHRRFTIKADTEYHIRAEKVGETLRLFINGELQLECDDFEHFYNGKVGIYTVGPKRYFYNIKLFKRNSPEHASPLSVANNYWLESRNEAHPKLRHLFLEKALSAYSEVIEENIYTNLIKEARIKRAYIAMDLQKYDLARTDLITVKARYDSKSILLAWLRLKLEESKWMEALHTLESVAHELPHHFIYASIIARKKILGISNHSPTEIRRQLIHIISRHSIDQRLDLSSCEIENLDFIKNTNFTDINVSRNFISNIDALKNLSPHRINLSNTLVSNLEALGGMKLTRLNCAQTPISSLKPIDTRELKLLNCSHTLVDRLENFENSKLEILSARRTAIRDLSPLKNLNLKIVDLSWTPVSDISVFADMPLKILKVKFSQVSDLTPLANTTLIGLNLMNCPVEDLEPLRKLRLEWFYLKQSRITNIDAISNHPLRNLALIDIPIENLKPLEGMPLEDLKIDRSRVTDIRPLSKTRLRVLSITNTEIDDLTPIAKLPLKYLNISHTKVKDLKPLQNMNLTSLAANGTRITSLRPLQDSSLEALKIKNTLVSRLDGIENTKIEFLSCSNTLIDSFAQLENTPIKHIVAHNLDIKSLRGLYNPVPSATFFDIPSIPDAEWYKAIRTWKNQPELETLIHNTKVHLALKYRKSSELRSLATTFRGHSYLLIHAQHPLKNIPEIARQVGAHSVSITTPQELDFIKAMCAGFPLRQQIPLFLEIDKEAQKVHWSNGEKSPFMFWQLVDSKSPIKTILLNDLKDHHDAETRMSFVIEWDD